MMPSWWPRSRSGMNADLCKSGCRGVFQVGKGLHQGFRSRCPGGRPVAHAAA